jgi:hypothetical protein
MASRQQQVPASGISPSQDLHSVAQLLTIDEREPTAIVFFLWTTT